MIKASLHLSLAVLFVILGCIQNKEIHDWRGPERNGIYSEIGLLKEWPVTGPELLWSYEGIGEGHSSVGIGKNRIFINGMQDTMGILYSFDMKGKLLWNKVYGEEWHVNYIGSRSAPIIIDDNLYLESGIGVVYCFDANSGEIKWSVDLLKEFNADNIKWGMSESLLIDGNNIICTPGGEVNNVVAINRFTGKIVWSSEGFKEPAAYCSPQLIEHGGTRLILTMTASSAIGLDADTGEMYWRVEQQQGNKIHANTPVYKNGIVYFSSSSAKQNGGLLALELSENGKAVKQLWRNEKFKNLMGGIVIINSTIYGSKYRSTEWYAINSLTGEENLLTDKFGNGVIIYADELFYCYSEKGEIALVQMTPESFKIKGKFKVPLGENQHWAHPVINNKRLYIRHGSALMVYDIAS